MFFEDIEHLERILVAVGTTRVPANTIIGAKPCLLVVKSERLLDYLTKSPDVMMGDIRFHHSNKSTRRPPWGMYKEFGKCLRQHEIHHFVLLPTIETHWENPTMAYACHLF